MKTLLVLRHAKSSWSDEAASDFDRILNDRGRRDAPRMGRLLREQRLVPDAIFASAAARTLETARLLSDAAGFAGPLIERNDLYLAGASQYIDVLRGCDDAIGSALVLGHNPGLQVLVSRLAGTEQTMPTAALAWFELPISRWAELDLGPTGKLRKLWRPKELDDLVA